MKIPFSLQEFLEVFEKYNKQVWPMQIVLYLLATVLVFLLLSKRRNAG
ncbi:DUF6064 family protein [Segetibacter koreensis]|nr:DUF6064 family protein [Segetibacter koreensis]